MNSNPNLNPLANHFRARNVTSDAKNGFAARSISGNNSNTGHWNNTPDNQSAQITTSPTRPVQTPRMPPQQQAPNNYVPSGAPNTATQAHARPGSAVPSQSQGPTQYPVQQTAPQLHTPPRPASSSPPTNTLGSNNRTPSPNSTPPSQPSPSPSPQRPTHLAVNHTASQQQVPYQQPQYTQPPQQHTTQQQVPYQQQQYAQQQQQQQYVPQQARPVIPSSAVKPTVSVAPPQSSVQPTVQHPPQVVQQPINQEPAVMPVHEQTTQEDLQSIPDDMLMALDEAQTLLNEQQSAHTVRGNEQPQNNAVPPPRLIEPQTATQQQSSAQQEQHVTPVNHEPAQHPDELERLRREVAQLKHDKSKEEELSRMQNQLQHARADLMTVRTQLTSTARKDQELKREMELLKEQLAWKDQELREVRMTQLEQGPATTAPPSTDTRMLEASDHEHVVYNVNTESDESEPLNSVNDQSTHVLNLRMKVGTSNTQANNSTAGGKHSPNNLQQLQIQGAPAKNRSSSSTKNTKSSPTQPSSSSTKKATVPSKGHKRSRDEMSRGHEETDEVNEPVNKEAAQLKLALYKARLRLHNIKKAVLTDVSEDKNQNAVNLDQLKAELLDCIQMQMTSQFDALKAEIANLAAPRATDDDVHEPPTKKRKVSEAAPTQPSEETEKQLESLRGQIEQLTKQHQAARDEAEKSRQTSESLNHMLTELKHVREQDVQRMTKLNEDKAELTERVTGLEAQLDKCAAFAEVTREAELLREQVQSLQDELTKSRDELSTLRTRAEAAERQLEAAEQRASELDQLFREESGKTARYQDDNSKLQQECDKLKVVCKQLYLQIKSSKTASTGSLNNSGNLATSSEGQTTTDAANA